MLSEQTFRDTETDKGMMLKPVYELTYTVCQQIGTESRIALCDFSEKCLPLIVALEGCSEKYNMMLLFVQIHHPRGVDADDEAAYACNWDLWKSIVRGIQANIVRDMKSEKLSPCLLKLACEGNNGFLFYQFVFQLEETTFFDTGIHQFIGK